MRDAQQSMRDAPTLLPGRDAGPSKGGKRFLEERRHTFAR
jgi:hypothetical protein